MGVGERLEVHGGVSFGGFEDRFRRRKGLEILSRISYYSKFYNNYLSLQYQEKLILVLV